MSIFGAFIVRIFLFRIFRIVLLSLHIQSEFGVFICLFIYLFYLFIYIFIYLFIHLFIYLFIYLLTCFQKTTIRNSLRYVFASFKVQIFIEMALPLFIILYCFRIEGFQSQCKVRAVYFCLNFLV